MDERIQRFVLSQLKLEADKARDMAISSRNLATAFSDATPSASGQRAEYEDAANTNEQTAQKISRLTDEISNSGPSRRITVEPPCFVAFRFDGDERDEKAIIAASAVHTRSLKFITPDAPISKAIMGKVEGEVVRFGQTTVKIKRIR